MIPKIVRTLGVNTPAKVPSRPAERVASVDDCLVTKGVHFRLTGSASCRLALIQRLYLGRNKIVRMRSLPLPHWVREKLRKQYTDIIGALVRKVKHIAATPGQEKMAA
jgi:hypothetical protein